MYELSPLPPAPFYHHTNDYKKPDTYYKDTWHLLGLGQHNSFHSDENVYLCCAIW